MPKSEKQGKGGKRKLDSPQHKVGNTNSPAVAPAEEEVPIEEVLAAEEPCSQVEEPKSELDMAQEQVCELQQQVEKLQVELASQKEKILYLQAEFDNAEKRRMKSLESERNRMRANIISAFLPLVDSFLPAVQKYEEGAFTDITQLGEGLKSLKYQLDTILLGFNAVPINEVNVPFDYNLHEVVMTQEREDLDDHTVLDIVHLGWKIGPNVIRPAKVVVSRLPAPPPVEADGENAPAESPTEEAPEESQGVPESQQDRDSYFR